MGVGEKRGERGEGVCLVQREEGDVPSCAW